MVFAELLITLEAISFFLFIKGVEERAPLFLFISFVIFSSMAVASFDVQAIFFSTSITSWEAVWISFAMAMISVIYAVLYTLTDFGKEMERQIGG